MSINEEEKNMLLDPKAKIRPGSLADSRKKLIVDKIMLNDEISTSHVRSSARAAKNAEDEGSQTLY